MLTQTVQVRVSRQAGPEAEVLRLKDERRRRSIKEDFASFGAGNVEGKWIRRIAEFEVARLGSD
jgi:hypothetical protein